MSAKHEAKALARMAQIAKTTLGIETLVTRKRDSLDFHDLAVWQVKAALEAAYHAGQKAGLCTKSR